jgi:glycine cleavage system H protein
VLRFKQHHELIQNLGGKTVNPEKLLYAKTHEWVSVESATGGNVATVGVSAFAVEALTDLVFMQLPQVGRKLKVGETFGEIESVKAVSDLYSPVDGEVVEVNSPLTEKLETLNSDPYGGGWLVKVKLADETALKNLMDYAAYQKLCAEEGH